MFLIRLAKSLSILFFSKKFGHVHSHPEMTVFSAGLSLSLSLVFLLNCLPLLVSHPAVGLH